MTSGQEERIAYATEDIFTHLKTKRMQVCQLQQLCKIRVREKSKDHTTQELVSHFQDMLRILVSWSLSLKQCEAIKLRNVT